MSSTMLVIFLVGIFSPIALTLNCDPRNPGSRQEGGWGGISQGECQGRGMCWDSGTPNAKWCYRGDDYCDTSNPGARVEGGWAGITPKQCLDRSMCWDASIPNVKWCFQRKPTAPQCDTANPESREEGGWAGISLNECLGRGMCWDSGTPNAKWCFKPRYASAPAPQEAGSTLLAGNLARPPAVFTTYPGFDIKGPNLAALSLPTLQACSDKCGRNRKCIAFVYYQDSQQCNLKDSVASFDDVGDEDIIAGLSQYVSVVQD